jgi:hypothetical protein
MQIDRKYLHSHLNFARISARLPFLKALINNATLSGRLIGLTTAELQGLATSDIDPFLRAAILEVIALREEIGGMVTQRLSTPPEQGNQP